MTELLNNLVQIISDKPYKGVFAWFSSFIIGVAPSAMLQKENIDMAVSCLQLVSLFIGSVAGVLTIISLLIKIKKKPIKKHYSSH